MIALIPEVKKLEIKNGILKKKAIYCNNVECLKELQPVLVKLPFDEGGAKLHITLNGKMSEAYELWIKEDEIEIKAEGMAGAFYGLQTLRQIFKQDKIPCLYIKDWPDFTYRGFYHDVTRGKIPTVDTIKKLIDEMAYYKLNSLQLYVEHVFEFKECEELHKKTGCLTKEEIREIAMYCKQNFIDFIPSLSTFGHLYELLQQDQYQYLRVDKMYEEIPHLWYARMRHHTIDPLHPDSFPIIKSLIDQYEKHFESNIFNICCDETFDLNLYGEKGNDVGKVYVDFVKQIIGYLKGKNKKVMMWADILLKHPEAIAEIPENTCFLNWNYSVEPAEEDIIKLAELNRKQIVCPGTSSWSRLCENVEVEEQNICCLIDYGYKHGAYGVLNTNWGDYGNPCSLDLAMYGLVLGAAKSWNTNIQIGDDFYNSVNVLLYENTNGIQYLRELSGLHNSIHWNSFSWNYLKYCFEYGERYVDALRGDIEDVQNAYIKFSKKLDKEQWINDEYRQEMLIAAEGICVMVELSAKIQGINAERKTSTKVWLQKYREKWLQKNKESELSKIEEMFLRIEEF